MLEMNNVMISGGTLGYTHEPLRELQHLSTSGLLQEIQNY